MRSGDDPGRTRTESFWLMARCIHRTRPSKRICFLHLPVGKRVATEGETVGAGVLLAQGAADQPSLGGWYVGIVIGVVVVIVVVVIVGLLLHVATNIRRQAGMAAAALDQAEVTTQPLWTVATTNRTAHCILEVVVVIAIRAREAVERG
jgi:hypothetical protein